MATRKPDKPQGEELVAGVPTIYIELAKLALENLRDKLHSGTTNQFMGVEGHVALMADKIHRWFETKEDDEILSFVSEGLLLMKKLAEK